MKVLRQLWHDAYLVIQGMSTNQKVAAACLLLTVAIWLTAAAWLGTAQNEVTKLPLPVEVEPADVNDLLEKLKTNGIKSAEYNFEAKRIIVNSEDEKKSIIILAENGLLKNANEFGFQEMLDKWAFSDTRLKSEEAMRLARATEVSRLIESLNNIKDAQVIYSDDNRSSLFGVANKKSASVRVRTKLNKKLSEDEANTIISLVAAAKSGLDERDVVVADQFGNKFHSSSGNGLTAMARQKWDTEFALDENLRRTLESLMRQYIPNIQYEGDVNAFPKHEVAFDYKEIMYKEVLPGEVGHSSTLKRTLTTNKRPAEEPGVNPNVRRTANMAGGGMGYIEESKSDEKTADKTMQNSIRETATKVAPYVKNLTISAILHLPYRLKRDQDGKPVQAKNEQGELLFNPDTKEIVWERESIDPLTADQVTELKRQIAQASGISLADIPEKIEVSQVPWQQPVYAAKNPDPISSKLIDYLFDAKSYLVTILAVIILSIVVYLMIGRNIPTELDDAVKEDTLSVSIKEDQDDDSFVDHEWEYLRAKMSALASEDPKRVALQLRRLIHKE